MRTHIGSCWLAFIMWRGAAASIEAQEPRIGPRCLPLFSEIVVVVVVVTTTTTTTTTTNPSIRVGSFMRGGGGGGNPPREAPRPGSVVAGSRAAWGVRWVVSPATSGVWCALIHSMTSCFDLK